MKQVDVLLFSVGQYFVAGVLNTVIGLALEAENLPVLATTCRAMVHVGDFSATVDYPLWWTVIYVGVFSVAMGYTLQAVGQKHAPAADAAIILSMEAVFAALFGYLLLHESLSPRQLLGCVSIFTAIVIVQFKPVGDGAGLPQKE